MIDINRFLKKEQNRYRFSYGRTDVGRLRKNNEDSFLINESKGLFVVSDGMGGHKAGETASKNACVSIDNYFNEEKQNILKKDRSKAKDYIFESISISHQYLKKLSQSKAEYENMGCTIVVALLLGNILNIVHVGDSRAYYFNGVKLKLLTKDHTYVMQLLDEGKISPEQAATSPFKHHLLQALGTKVSLFPSFLSMECSKDDQLLLCSDGLWDMVSEDEIIATLSSDLSLKEKSIELIRKANQTGGKDNITALIVKFPEINMLKNSEDEEAGNYSIVF